MLADLFNSHMSGVDIAFGFANMIGISYAIYRNVRGSKTSIFSKHLSNIAILSSIYFIAYIILMFSELDQASWSSVMRGVSVLAWFYVWPAAEHLGSKIQEELPDQLEKEVLRRMGIEDGNER